MLIFKIKKDSFDYNRMLTVDRVSDHITSLSSKQINLNVVDPI